MAAAYHADQPYGLSIQQSRPRRTNTDATDGDVELWAYPTGSFPSIKPLMVKKNELGPDISHIGERTVASRTPSPTLSERRELRTGVFDWKSLRSLRFWFRREWLWYYVAFFIICVVTALVTLYHKQIVHWLTPVTRWLHDLKYGWLVPIAILFIISFPPLFGHEIVAILCGLVWGLWVGFGIVCIGTFLGEVGNFYAFKWCCRARGEKLEKTKLSYACLAKVVRDGGFTIALTARLSAIPGHFTTAVFSACGMGIVVFSLAAILSLPKQLITVYLGVMLEQSSDGTSDTKSRLISDIVLGVTFLITVAAMWYIYHRMNKAKPDVIYERRKARQAKNLVLYKNPFASQSTSTFDSCAHLNDIPVTTPISASYVNNSSSTSHLQVPQPRRIPSNFNRLYDVSSSDEVRWDMAPMQHAKEEEMAGYPISPMASSETIVAPHQDNSRLKDDNAWYDHDEAYGGMHEDTPSTVHERIEPRARPSLHSPPPIPKSLQPRHQPSSLALAGDTNRNRSEHATWIPAQPLPPSMTGT